MSETPATATAVAKETTTASVPAINPAEIDWLESGENSVQYCAFRGFHVLLVYYVLHHVCCVVFVVADEVLDEANKDVGIYGSAESSSFQVRGENYLVDKVKFPSRQARIFNF